MKLNELLLEDQLLEEHLQYLPEGVADIIRKLPTKYKKIAIAAALILFPSLTFNFSKDQLLDVKNTIDNITQEQISKIVDLFPGTDDKTKITKEQMLRAVDAQFKLYKEEKQKKETYVSTINNIFNGADKNVVRQVVDLAHKYERPDFPRAKDILSIVAIESSFDPSAKSKLKKDPAIGLTQIRPGVWNIPKEELNNIENQIKHGADILAHYFDKLKDKESAIIAYNKGITAFKKGKYDQKYLNKFKTHYAKLFGKEET
jgi:hypothetical protein